MSIPVCDQCDGYIEVNNRRFTGHCSPRCRDLTHQRRAAEAAKRAQRRADRLQQAAAHTPVHNFLT